MSVHVETNINFATASDEEIKQFGRNIVRDNIVVVRNQNLDERRILHICETIGTVLKPKQFFMHPEHSRDYFVLLMNVKTERRLVSLQIKNLIGTVTVTDDQVAMKVV